MRTFLLASILILVASFFPIDYYFPGPAPRGPGIYINLKAHVPNVGMRIENCVFYDFPGRRSITIDSSKLDRVLITGCTFGPVAAGRPPYFFITSTAINGGRK